MNTSYSALDSFRTCPLKYKFEQIDKIRPEKKSAPAVFGSLVHSAMKFIHSGNFLLPTQKEALEYFTKNWNPEPFEDEFQERSAFATGVKIIQDYYRKNDPNKVRIVDLESRFSLDVDHNSETHYVSGFIDRIDKLENGFEIIDYKTSNKLPPQSKIEEDLQLLIYLLAFLKRYPQLKEAPEKIKLSLYFLKHSTKLSTVKTKQQLEEEKIQILDLLDEIKQSNFEPKLNPLCDWCDFQRRCPMWRHKYKQEEQAKQDNKKKDSQKIIQEFIDKKEKINQAKKEVADLQQQIYEIMDQDEVDRLFCGNKIVARSPIKSYEYDNETVKRILEEAGAWQEVIKIDKTKLNKVLPSLPPASQKKIEKSKQLKRQSWSLSVKKNKEI